MQLFVGHPDTNGKMLAGEISGGLLLGKQFKDRFNVSSHVRVNNSDRRCVPVT